MSARKPKVEVFESWSQWPHDKCQHYWRIRAANNKIIADSGEGYHSRRNAIRAFETVIDAVAEIARDQGRYEE